MYSVICQSVFWINNWCNGQDFLSIELYKYKNYSITFTSRNYFSIPKMPSVTQKKLAQTTGDEIRKLSKADSMEKVIFSILLNGGSLFSIV